MELGGVDYVLEDAVEASGYGGYGGEECVAKPDGNDGIFLS